MVPFLPVGLSCLTYSCFAGISDRRIEEELAALNENYSGALTEFSLLLPRHQARAKAYKVCLHAYSPRIMEGWAWAKNRRQEQQTLVGTPGFNLDMAEKKSLDEERQALARQPWQPWHPSGAEPEWTHDHEPILPRPFTVLAAARAAARASVRAIALEGTGESSDCEPDWTHDHEPILPLPCTVQPYGCAAARARALERGGESSDGDRNRPLEASGESSGGESTSWSLQCASTGTQTSNSDRGRSPRRRTTSMVYGSSAPV